MKKSKERAKGFIFGFILATALSATAVFAANYATLIEVFYGVNVVVNGDQIDFAEDSRPFLSGGRTFLPLRAMADALDMPLYWDAATQTAYFGTWPFDGAELPGRWRVAVIEDIFQGTSWVEEFDDFYIEFFTNGNARAINDGITENLLWSFEGNIIYLVEDGEEIAMTAEQSGSALILTWDDGDGGGVIMRLYRAE